MSLHICTEASGELGADLASHPSIAFLRIDHFNRYLLCLPCLRSKMSALLYITDKRSHVVKKKMRAECFLADVSHAFTASCYGVAHVTLD